MMRPVGWGLGLMMGLFIAGGVVVGEVPQLINYQGRLTEADGQSLVGEHTVTFRIYNAEAGGSKLWEESHQISLTRQDNGIFSIVLGSLKAFGTLELNQPLWLTLEVDGEGEMTPRQRMTAVGYAVNADTLDGLDNSQLLRADVDTVAKGQLTLARSGTSLVLQPSADPAANTKLIDVRNAAGTSRFSVDLEGDLAIVGALPAHASTHQPGGSDALLTASAASVGSANAEGTSTSVARADHTHQGLHSLNASGQPQLFADVTLAAGDNVTLTQAGQTITIAAEEEEEAAFARASTSSSSSLAIGTTDTTLLSLTVTKANANSALLIIATVAIAQTTGGAKTVNVKVRRDGTLLDSAYPSRIGPGGGQAESAVVTIHAWDPTTSGSHTIDLLAVASGTGATATVRRLTVVELL